MTEDEIARLTLLATIEGNSRFWHGEIKTLGAPALVEAIRDGKYRDTKSSGPRIMDALSKVSQEQLVESLSDLELFTPRSPDWPEQHNQLLAPPFALIGMGKRAAIEFAERSLAIVGSRNPTHYGSRIASEFAANLADRDFLIVSGGAIGIDSDAHRGTLAADGVTIAVLGGGVHEIYPASNANLYRAIAENGLLLSEVLPHVRALPHRFLIRNRLIAALSLGTVVVEAALRSGSIRTARDAGELFRPVMAIPGLITSPTSAGCHALISERKAELVSSVEEIVQMVEPL